MSFVTLEHSKLPSVRLPACGGRVRMRGLLRWLRRAVRKLAVIYAAEIQGPHVDPADCSRWQLGELLWSVAAGERMEQRRRNSGSRRIWSWGGGLSGGRAGDSLASSGEKKSNEPFF